MAKILDEIKRLEELKQQMEEHFDRAAQLPNEKDMQIGTGYAAVTMAIHDLRNSDSFFSEVISELEERGTEEAMKEAATMRRERERLRP